MTRIFVPILLLASLVAMPVTAASGASRPLRANYALDGSITAGAVVLAMLVTEQAVEPGRLWESEWLGVDHAVRANFSRRAALASDIALNATTVAPLVAGLGLGVDEAYGQRTLIYAETLALNALVTTAIKYWVQRPRPYAYNGDPLVAAYTTRQGKDAYLSFFSGHASGAFAAAVAGSMLFGQASSDANARAALWGSSLALASAAAHLRVRAGKHFYSDVAVGAAFGALLGAAVPLLHQREGQGYRPQGREWAAMGGGLALGLLASSLLPLEGAASAAPEANSAGAPRVRHALVPTMFQQGAGLAWVGSF